MPVYTRSQKVAAETLVQMSGRPSSSYTSYTLPITFDESHKSFPSRSQSWFKTLSSAASVQPTPRRVDVLHVTRHNLVHTPGFRLVEPVSAVAKPVAALAPVAMAAPKPAPKPLSVVPKAGRFWAMWDTWYSAFLAEARDEMPVTSGSTAADMRRAHDLAELRWIMFCAKKLHCNESDVTDWLCSATPSKTVA